jgi:protein-S-isoprenylcysteine O-methyltransferase Ste14
MNTKTHPGIYIPPPLIYVALFFCSIFLQKLWPLDRSLLNTPIARVIGCVMIGFYVLLAFAAIRRFVLSNNTLVTIKPANSLQTSGIYSLTRNPMYLSLVFLYCGLAVFVGNWWTFVLLPILIIVIQLYVIKKEEGYLHHAFGKPYEDYTKRVRRWI